MLFYPFQDFFKNESSAGILLMVTTLIALVWANSPWGEGYLALWETKITVGSLSKSLLIWINDGLMAIFFFVVGLEIKRELQTGELSSWRTASLPVIAALGGMILPAGIFAFFNHDQPWINGWGVPMATDIAFSLGVLSLLGKRVPLILKIFLTAFAIVDDIGAVLVIAVFYTSDLHLNMLALGGAFFGGAILLNFMNIRQIPLYLLLGAGMWSCFLKSGVHPTVAGVLLAFTIPSNPKIMVGEFVSQIKDGLRAFEGYDKSKEARLSPDQLASVEYIFESTEKVQSPSQKLENALHGWVIYFIMPVFALANAGVAIGGNFAEALTHPLTLTLAASLFFGKIIGISGFVWLALKAKIADMPQGIRFGHFVGLSILGGVGFTMALFVANLAYSSTPAYLVESKVSILAASVFAGVLGYFFLDYQLKKDAKLAKAAEQPAPSKVPV